MLGMETPLTQKLTEHGSQTWGPPGGSKGDDQGLPVLIFIYGGGFSTGGEDVPYQIAAQWVNRTPNHIVVSFNYRVNIFGFPNAAGLGEQNFGLLDQRAAVEWVQKNIAAFGGDPTRMVIWGQSAGSISVDYYNYAYSEDPIVTGLIMDSGTAFSSISTDDTTHSNITFVADHVGCNGTANDAAQQLACMRNASASSIEDFVATYEESGATPALSFDPIVDGTVVFANYTARALAGQQAKIVSSPPLNNLTSRLTGPSARNHRHQRPRRRALRHLQPLRPHEPNSHRIRPPPDLLLPGN
jgi:cholinesterase